MSDYQRFVSYLYEYCHNEKSGNCGFVRAEVRNSQCKLEIHMKLPPYPFLPVFRIYLFVFQDEKLLGIPLGTAHYQQGTVYGTFTFPDTKISGTSWNVNDLGGVLIQSDSGQCFATAWKEIPIRPESFAVFENRNAIHAASIEETCLPSPQQDLPPARKTSEDSSDGKASDCPPPEKPVETFQEFQTRLEKSYPPIQPFFDDEIHSCIRLSTKDLPILNTHGFSLGSNRFLLHSCYLYQHFLLGKLTCNDSEKHILAVPGIYDEKECSLAGMFGFPFFKPSRNPMVRPGQFGYWYRFLC